MPIVFKTISPSALKKTIEESSGRQVKNTTGADIPPYRVLSWKEDGSVEMATCLVDTMADFAGFSAEIIPRDAFGRSIRDGRIPGILVGLGALPGQPVFMGISPGSLTLAVPTAPGARIIQLGYAEPPTDNVESGAIDLRIALDELAEF